MDQDLLNTAIADLEDLNDKVAGFHPNLIQAIDLLKEVNLDD